MTAFLQTASLVVAAAALFAALVTFASTRRPLLALAVFLELLLAAGLLRIAAIDDWAGIGAAALIVVIRRIVVTTLRRDLRTLDA